MLWKLTFFVLVSITSINCQETTDSTLCSTAQSNCDECINAHPNCIWCLDADKASKRCQLSSDPCTTAESPKSNHELLLDKNFTIAGEDFFDNLDENAVLEVIQLRPQKLKIKLRKNEPYKFNITFKKVIDYPLDFYYVMDLSFSMKDDLKNLQTLGVNLVNQIRENITKNAQFGYGTFVDKVVTPYVSTQEDKLKNPCLDEVCAPPFGFRHQLNISFPGNDSETNAFSNALLNTKISGNIDVPEGGFDALMQIAVCKEQIGWRDIATHIVLFASDAPPHMANDGKLAGILTINDMKCHLEKAAEFNPNLNADALVYARSKYDDYPSVGQLKKVFIDNKIQVIFAVTNSVFDLYEDLPQVLVNNIFVSELREDSSNILELVENAYNVLRGKLSLNKPTPPEGVEMKFRYLCPNESKWIENKDIIECNNIQEGDNVIYEFELKATKQCSKNTHSMMINSNSLQDEVELVIEYICECGCKVNSESNSTKCSEEGSLVCGTCDCNSGKTGRKCQCEAYLNGTDVNESCKKPESELYCEDKGECDCGVCDCQDGFQDKYCHCNPTGCPVDQNNKLCGQGTCKNCDNNPVCLCENEWTTDTFGVCACNEALCTTEDGVLCNNKGTCNCNSCQCDEQYSGTTCTQCEDPRCIGIDATCDNEKVQSCVLCIAKKNQASESEGACSKECADGLRFKIVSTLYNCDNCTNLGGSLANDCFQDCERHKTSAHFTEVKGDCAVAVPDTNCRAYYDIYWLQSFEYILYVREYNLDTDCDKPIPTLLIVGPVVGSIVFIGLILLLGWKIIQTQLDKREYMKFEAERERRKWTKGENPLYENAEETFKNPAFDGREDNKTT